MANKHKSFEELNPPEEFYKIINDFISDIVTTFPEYAGLISKWWNRPSSKTKEEIDLEKEQKKETLFVFRHCVKIFPERFFDILYKNKDIFSEESELSTEFLPGIVFKQMWSCDISDKTRETIWKYLQLILFSVIGCVHNKSELGDTAKLFEAIDEEELKKKLQETLEGMQNLFDTPKTGSNDTNDNTNDNNTNADTNDTNTNASNPNINMENMPNAQDIHSHINSMMGGKLGKLAMELAEETAEGLNLDMENTGDTKEVFQKLFQNPAKMMSMVKNIGSKIDDRIKSGEIKESELMKEGMELLEKMKNMPGMGDMQKMFSQMGIPIPGLGKGAKLNMGAMEANLNKNMREATIKERIKAKAVANAKAREQAATAFCNMTDINTNANANANANANTVVKPPLSDEEILKIFSTGEIVEKTPRGAKPPTSNKKKKGKK
jgi:hypothetical protein